MGLNEASSVFKPREDRGHLSSPLSLLRFLFVAPPMIADGQFFCRRHPRWRDFQSDPLSDFGFPPARPPPPFRLHPSFRTVWLFLSLSMGSLYRRLTVLRFDLVAKRYKLLEKLPWNLLEGVKKWACKFKSYGTKWLNKELRGVIVLMPAAPFFRAWLKPHNHLLGIG